MRILHTMLRVGNLDRSLDFYTNVLGMRVLRKKDYPDGKFTLAFVGYQDEADGAVITTVLVERDGRTTMTATARYRSQRQRDALLATPMERGAGESYERLAAVLGAEAARPRGDAPDAPDAPDDVRHPHGTHGGNSRNDRKAR